LLGTEDTANNEVNLVFSKDKTRLDIAVKQPVKMLGDMDVLLKLDLA